MNPASTLYQQGSSTPEEAMALFDGLEPADIEYMKGYWAGSGFLTGHRLDGMLEAFGWYGKAFIDEERVHPLLFRDSRKRLFAVHPGRLPVQAGLHWPAPKVDQMRYLILAMRPLLATRKFCARLRMVAHRGKPTAGMIYDDLPIIDLFRRVDDNNVLAIMDLRGLETPFFFRLTRVPTPD